MNVVALLGSPGAGKSTLAGRLREHDAVVVRVMAPRELGPEVAAGQLVSDQVALASVTTQLHDATRTATLVVLDGFPRTLGQARMLTAWCADRELPLTAVVLDPPEAVRTARLRARAKVEARADDRLEAVRLRLRLHEEVTAPAIDWLRAEGVEVLDLSDGSPSGWAAGVVAALAR